MRKYATDPDLIEIRRERMLQKIPPRYAHAVPEHLPRQVAEWCELAARGERRSSLLLMGVTGTGKTHTAFAAVRRLFDLTAALPRITKATELYAELRPSAGVDGDPLARYKDAELLMLDDLGAAKYSEWVEEVTLRLIDYRYEHNLPTIVTTNINGADFPKVLGDRVVSRLREMCETVLFEGTDKRRQNPVMTVERTAPAAS